MHILAATGPLPVGELIALLVFGIALLLVLILRFKLQAFLALIVVSVTVAAAAKIVNPDANEYELNLISASGFDELPDEGRLLVVVAQIKETLHIRIFNSDGERIIDKPESELVDGTSLEKLKEWLNSDPLPNASTLRPAEKIQIIEGAASISGLTLSLPLTRVAGTIVNSMGGALGFIAAIIGIGAIFGSILEHSGGTQALATSLVRKFGQDRAPWAMLVTGFIISIPVFLDVALVMLAPLLYALARDTKKPLLVYGLPLCAGMAITHAFVPPTPGPVAVAYILGVNLGWVILFGLIIGLPTAIICGPWLTNRLAKNIDIQLPPIEPDTPTDSAKLPSFGFILFLIALPIGLILTGTVVEQMTASSLPAELSGAERKTQLSAALAAAPFFKQFIYFIGHPVIALLLSTLVALHFLGTRRGVSREKLLDISTKALGPAGIIILITGAGGVFKGVLEATGITDALVDVFGSSDIRVLVLAYIFATLVRIAQGSATVAMLTAAGLMVGFVEGLSQPHLALVVIAIAAGATGFSHVNDSGFWMISRYFRMTEAQTLRSWSILSTIISVVGFGLCLLVSTFV